MVLFQERGAMTNYAIHRKPSDDAIYIITGNVKGYSILTLVDAVDADTPLEAAKLHIGE
jgi:hypothetical protein